MLRSLIRQRQHHCILKRPRCPPRYPVVVSEQADGSHDKSYFSASASNIHREKSYDQHPQQQRHARIRKQTRKHIGDTYSQLTEQLLDRNAIPLGSFSTNHFQGAIKAIHRWSSLHSSTGVDKSLQLLDRSLEEVDFYSKAGQLLPTIRVQNLLEVIVNGWRICFSQNHSSNNPSTMTPYQMLERLETFADKHPELLLNDKLHNMLLDAAANARSYSDGPVFCDSLLQTIISNAQQPSSSSPIPTPIGFGSVIHAWATSSHPDSSQKAQDTLQHMDHLQQHWWPSLIPTVIHNNTVLNAWARGGHAERAESLLRTMYEDYASGKSSTPPDVVSFTTVLAAHAKARSSSSSSSLQGNAERAEAILHLMLELYDSGELYMKPDAIAMNTVLHCWTKCKSEDAAARAHAMLTNMRDLSHAGDVDFAPDRISYNTVINAWAKAGKEYHAIALLEEMNHEHARGKMELKPDRTTYATVLSSFLHSKSVDSARQAEEFLNQMPTLGVQPDVICYNIVLECYAKSDDPKAAERAEALLQEMTDPLKHDTKISPDVVSYSSVLKAWSTSPDRKAPESAEAHFKELLSIYKGGNKSMKPDDRCFLAMITVWSKCRRSCAGTKAEEYLRLMLEINPFDKSGHRRLKAHYNCAIRAWAFSQVSEGVSRAEALLREMLDLAEAGNQDIMPDGTSCGWLLKTIAMSKVTDKTKKADQVMEIMAQHGLKLDSFGKRYLERCRKK